MKVVLSVVVVLLVCAASATAAATITGSQVKDNSLSGRDIKNRSLKSADLSRSTVRSLRGHNGRNGAPGANGANGVAGIQVVESAHITIQPGDVQGVTAACPAGKTVIGSGFYASITDVGFVKAFGTTVGGGFINNTSIPVDDVHVQAICASGGAVAARASSSGFKHALDALR